MPAAPTDRLAIKLAPWRCRVPPLMTAILGYLLYEPWGDPPIRRLEVRPDGKVLVDGDVACTVEEIGIAIDLTCEAAGLTDAECERLYALINARHWFARTGSDLPRLWAARTPTLSRQSGG